MNEPAPKPEKATRLDHIGLNATNFFLAELTGVILPFLSDFLKEQHWNYSRIGLTVAMVGLGMFFFQIPAGIVSDKIWRRRLMLSGAAILSGGCYSLLPYVIHHQFIVDGLLFVAGMATAFFIPLLAALALSLVGHDDFDKTYGTNQSWNHIGNITVSIASLICVKFFGISSIFYVVGGLAVMASVSLRFITRKHLNLDLSKERVTAGSRSRAKISQYHPKGLKAAMMEQFQDPTVLILIACVVLYNIANAPGMSAVGLYLKSLGAPDNYIAWGIIIGQGCMIPVAYLAAKFCGSHGRKPVMVLAFISIVIRLVLYPQMSNPNEVLALQMINGIDAGIYSVVIALICGDLTKGKEGFNTILAIMQLAIAFANVCGPVLQGFLTQYMGFMATFLLLAIIAGLGGLLFIFKMPETGEATAKAPK